MPRPLPLPAELLDLAAMQEHLVSAAQCAAAGVSRDRATWLAPTGRWARITRGVYDVDPTPVSQRSFDHRRRRAAWVGLLAFGPGAIAVLDALQVEISEAGRIVGRGDLGWRLDEDRWLIAEIDGAEVHDVPEAVFADRSRQNVLVSTGRVELLRYTSQDLQMPRTVARGVRRALRSLGVAVEPVVGRPTDNS